MRRGPREARRATEMQVRANGLRIEVDEQGPLNAEPLLLIMGLGMQLTGWPEPLVQTLVRRADSASSVSTTAMPA